MVCGSSSCPYCCDACAGVHDDEEEASLQKTKRRWRPTRARKAPEGKGGYCPDAGEGRAAGAVMMADCRLVTAAASNRQAHSAADHHLHGAWWPQWDHREGVLLLSPALVSYAVSSVLTFSAE